MSRRTEFGYLLAHGEKIYNGGDQKSPSLDSSAGVGYIRLSFPCVTPIFHSIARISHPAVHKNWRTNTPHVAEVLPQLIWNLLCLPALTEAGWPLFRGGKGGINR